VPQQDIARRVSRRRLSVSAVQVELGKRGAYLVVFPALLECRNHSLHALEHALLRGLGQLSALGASITGDRDRGLVLIDERCDIGR
jgi:hypothetical protein